MAPVIVQSDFWTPDSVLHPLVVGSIILVVVYVYIRLASPRSFAQLSIFSMLSNITLGSTMSRIITQPGLNLVRGLISIFIILFLMHFSDELATRWKCFEKLFRKSPRLLLFRGQILQAELRKNRLTENAMYVVLRQGGGLKFDELEAVVLEMNGALTTVKALDDPINQQTPSLDNVPGYSKLRAEWAQAHGHKPQKTGTSG